MMGWPLPSISFALVVPLGFGYALIDFLLRRTHSTFATKLALGYLLGTGTLTFWILLLSILGLSWNLTSIGLPLLAAAAGISLFKLKLNTRVPSPLHRQNPSVVSRKNFNIIDILLLLFIFLQVLYIFWRTLNLPIYSYLALRITSLKAKVFFYDGAVILRDEPFFFGYPLLAPLSQTWLALNLHTWDEQWTKLFFPLFALAFFGIFYDFLKQQAGPRQALIGLFLLLAAPLVSFHATIAYTDLPLMAYTCSAIILLIVWNDSRDAGWLLAAGLLAGFAAFTKREGLFFLLVHGLLLTRMLHGAGVPAEKKLRSWLTFLLPAITIPAIFWLFLILGANLPTEDTQLQVSLDLLARPPVILHQFIRELFFSGNWSLIWFFLGCSLWCRREMMRRDPRIKFLGWALILFFGLYGLIFMTTTAFKWIDASDAVLSRLILHFFPLAPLLIILLLQPQQDRRL